MAEYFAILQKICSTPLSSYKGRYFLGFFFGGGDLSKCGFDCKQKFYQCTSLLNKICVDLRKYATRLFFSTKRRRINFMPALCKSLNDNLASATRVL